MTAIISNNTLGLMSSSLTPSRTLNVGGFGAPGQSGEAMYVNVATGNLVVQRQDEMLKARGLDIDTLLTYNSQGQLDGDNNDNWRIGFYRQVKSLIGTVNKAGSTIIRVDADGAERTYVYASGLYVSTDGDGSHDTLQYNDGSVTQWTWTDGDSRVTEIYDWNTVIGKLTSRRDAAGNSTDYDYNTSTGLLSQVRNPLGDSTVLDYTGLNLTRLRMERNDGSTSTRVLYEYDGANRLTKVTVDLSPDDNSIVDKKVYVSNYTYDGSSRRIATLTQSDGTSLAFAYDASGRVKSIADALGRQCSYAYDSVNRVTTVTDALGLQSTWRYDAKGQLLQTTSANGTGGTLSRSYAYSGNGDLVQVTDELGRSTVMQYDPNGNQTLQRDDLGNTVTRTFDGNNQLLSETTYLVPDPDGLDATNKNSLGAPGTPLTTRYVYDAAGKSQLRFVISPEGRVTEYRYDSYGQRVAAIDYASTQYAGTSALESDLSSWAASGAVDRTRSVRTDYAWDFRGQLSSSTVWGSVNSAGNGVAGTSAVTRYVYDARGLLLSTIAPLGGAAQTTSYVYDGLGRTVRVTNGLGELTSTSYDDAGNRVVVTAANGLVTTSSRDAAGRLVSLQNRYQSSSTTSGPIYSTERYFYDKGDRLRMTQDATGVRTWLLYDDANRKVGEIDGNGSLTEYIYNAAGQLTRTIRYATAASTTGLTVNADGSPSAGALALTLSALRPAPNATQDQSTWNAYDSAGRLVETVDAGGGVTETRYDGASRVTSVIAYANRISTATLGNQPSAASIAPVANAKADQVIRNFYDNDGLLQGTLDAEGYLVEILYDAAGRETQRTAYANPTNSSLRAAGTLTQLWPTTNANDISSWRFYDDRNQLVAEIDGEKYLTEYLYDANGNQQQSIRYANRVTAAISAGAALASLRPATSSADQTLMRTYDVLNRLFSETDFEGTQTTYAYDSAGNLTQVVKAADTSEARTTTTTYNQAGQISAETNGKNKTTTSYALDLAGRRISETDANGNGTLYYYGADDQLVYSINALGEVSANVYNTLHQRTAEIRYGSRLDASTLATMTGGLVTSSVQSAINALANATLDSRTSYTYNLDGTLASSIDALNKATSYQYDAFGNRTSVTTPISSSANLEETYAYDRRNLQTSMREDPTVLNVTTSMQYDAFGRVISQTDGRNDTSQQSYDKLGRVVQTRDRLNQTQSSTYDAFDRVLTQTDSLGSVTSYTYSTATRSVSIRTPEGITVTTARNRHGQTQTVTDGRGYVTTYVYDTNGNLTQTTSPAGQITTQRYDDADRLIETTDANGIKTAISYNPANRVLSRTVDPNATGYIGLNLVTTYDWDAKGQQIRVTDPLGVATEIVYALNGQVTGRTVDSGVGRLNLDTLYSYDDLGKTLTVTDDAGGVTQYGYDKLGRRIQERIDPTGLNLTTRYEYDANDNVVAKIDANGNRIRYAYDDEDRLRFEVDALGQVKETCYDAERRVSRTIGYANPISLTGLGASVADITPRLVSDPARDNSESRVYDRDGRQSYSIDGTGAVKKYDYDANGNVVRQTAYANPRVTFTDIAGQFAATADQESFALRSTVTFNVAVAGSYTFFTTSDDGSRLYIGGTEIINDQLQAANQVTASVTLAAGTHTLVQTYFDYNNDNSNDFGILSGPAGTSASNNFGVSFGPINVEVFDFDGDYTSLNTTGHASLGLTNTAQGSRLTLVGQVHAIATDVTQMGKVVICDPSRDQVIRNFYDAANRLQYMVDGVGAVTKYDHDANGNIIRQTAYVRQIGPDDAASTVLAVADRDQVTRNFYDAANRLQYMVDGVGAVTKYDYDANGNIIRQTAYVSRIGPNDAASTVLTVAGGDKVIRNFYDAANRLTRTIDALGGVRGLRYDAKGNVVQETAFAKGISRTVVVRAKADTDNHYSMMELRLNGSTVAQYTVTHNTYEDYSFTVDWPVGDTASLDVVFTNGDYLSLPGGRNLYVEKVTIDGVDYQATSAVYDRASLFLGLASAFDGVNTLPGQALLDRNGALRFSIHTASLLGTDRIVYGQASDADQVTRNFYDAANRLTNKVNGTGAVTKYDYDANGNVIRQTAYANLIGTAALPASVLANASLDQITHHVYDPANRLAYAVDGTGAVKKYDYDAFGNIVQETAYANPLPDGKAMRLPSLQSGNRSVGEIALGQFHVGDRVTMTAYFRADSNRVAGRLQLDAGTTQWSNDLPHYTSALVYGTDTWQKLTVTVDVEQDCWLLAYIAGDVGLYHPADQCGYYDNVVVSSRVRGVVLDEKFKSAAWGRAGGRSGTLVQVATLGLPTDAPAMGGLIAADSTRDRVTNHEYDAANHRIQTTLPLVGVYTDESQTVLIANGANALAIRRENQQRLFTRNVYDTAGNIVATQDTAGDWSYRTYDRSGHLRFEVDREGYSTGYEYDAFGNVINLTRYARQIGDATRAGWNEQSPTVDTLNSLLAHDTDARTINSRYNARGQVTQVTEPEVYANDGRHQGQQLSPTTWYTYDAFGQQVQTQRLRIDAPSLISYLTSYRYFGNAGHEVAAVDEGGYLTKRRYDVFGNVIEVTEYAAPSDSATMTGYSQTLTGTNDRQVRFTYDSANREKSETRVNVRYSVAGDGDFTDGDLINEYDYDAFGNQIRMRDAGGNLTLTYYDAANRIRAVTTPTHAILNNASFTGLTEFFRDAWGNVLRQVERANGASSTGLANYTTSVDSVGDRVNTAIYDTWGRAIQTIDVEGQSQYFSFDNAGNLAKQWSLLTSADGSRRTLFKQLAYDKVGHLTATIEPASNAAATSSVVKTQMRYNAFGELDRRGVVGAVVAVRTSGDVDWAEYFDYDNAGRVWRTNSGDGVNKVMLYDLQGNLTAQIRNEVLLFDAARVDRESQDGTRRVDYVYDALGRVTRETQASWLVTGSPSRPVITRSYDRWGNQTSTTDADNHVTTMRYDAGNQLISVTGPAFYGYCNDGSYDDMTPETLYFYNYAGRQLASYDQRNNLNRQTWDSVGNLLSEIHADGGVVNYAYDAFGNQKQRTDTLGNITSYDYDKLNRLRYTYRPAANFYTIDDRVFPAAIPVTGRHGWDQAGATQWYWAGQYQYSTQADDVMRWTSSLTLRGEYQAYVDSDDTLQGRTLVTGSGNLPGDGTTGIANHLNYLRIESSNRNDPVRPTDGSAITTTLTNNWDENGNKLESINAADQHLRYQYDLRGNVVTSTAPGGARTRFEYDYLDRKTREVDALGRSSSWTYDYFGRLVHRSVDLVNGENSETVEFDYRYDDFGQLFEEIRSNAGYNPQVVKTYGYDGAGQVITVTDMVTAGKSRLTEYGYGRNGHRVSERTSIDGMLVSQTTSTYDSNGRLSRVDVGDRWLQIFYDAAGNRIKQLESLGGAASFDVRYSFFAYDAMNRQILVDGEFNNDASRDINLEPVMN